MTGTPIQDAIDAAAADWYGNRDMEMRAWLGALLRAFEHVQSGAVVTAERAALEAMAQHECYSAPFRGLPDGCLPYFDPDRPFALCAPCFARRTLAKST